MRPERIPPPERRAPGPEARAIEAARPQRFLEPDRVEVNPLHVVDDLIGHPLFTQFRQFARWKPVDFTAPLHAFDDLLRGLAGLARLDNVSEAGDWGLGTGYWGLWGVTARRT